MRSRWARRANRGLLWYLWLSLVLPAALAVGLVIRAPRVLFDPDAGTFLVVLVAVVVLLGIRLIRR